MALVETGRKLLCWSICYGVASVNATFGYDVI